jgi:hypothetical protein
MTVISRLSGLQTGPVPLVGWEGESFWLVFCNETDIVRTTQDRTIQAAIEVRGGPVR